MTFASNLDQAPETSYAQDVDVLLEHRYGMTIAVLFADNVVEAARRAGYSPTECADWLAEVDGLT